jgi:DNA repair protein RadC
MEGLSKPKHDYIGHRKRLRERFRRGGIEGLHDYEVLELLLTYAVPRRDVKPIAKRLIESFGSLAGVLDAGPERVEQVGQVGPSSSTLLRLVKETCEAYLAERMERTDVLSSPRVVQEFARLRLAGLPHEAFMVIYLNAKNRVLSHHIMQEGTVTQAAVYPRRIVEEALARHAAGVIVVHNHPSGEVDPSAEDRLLTRSLQEATRALDIRILDHLIVGREGYFSFAESGLL